MKTLSQLLTLRATSAGVLMLAGLTALVVAFAPREAVLGDGIRVVYVHVALTWAGMSALCAAGLLGLVVLFTARANAFTWERVLSRVGLAFYIAGFILSMAASQTNWGGVAWQEPRTIAALQTIALGVIVQVFHFWATPLRIQGALDAALAIFLLWIVRAAALILHPQNPIGSSSSLGIQLAFLASFVFVSLAAAWLAAFWRAQE